MMDELRGRLHLPGRGEGVADDGRTMALAIAALFVAGAVIGSISLLLPHPEAFNETALWSNIAFCLVGAGALTLLSGRLPPFSMQIVIALGTLIITRAVYYSDEPSGFYSFFYIWVGLYAFFFFGRAWGSAHMVLVGIAYGWVLTQAPHTAPVGRWLMTVGTIAVAGAFVEVSAGRVRRRADEAQSQARALAAVDEVAHELVRSTTPREAASGICAAAAEASEASGAMLWEITSDGTGLEVTAATDRSVEGTRLLFVGPTSGAVSAFSSRKPLFVSDAQGHPDVDQGLVERLGVRSVLFQPMMREGVPTGVIAIHWSRRIASIDEIVARTVTLLATEASLAIERAELMERLERAARTDDLTGLPNRGAWDEELSREVARARRSGAPLCLALIDLDRFKDYNDTHGHQAGDRLLKVSAARWGEELRDTDLLARYGGDEFALALPDCDLPQAAELLERLRAATPENEQASAGVVRWDGSEPEAELFARADRALYGAKESGRNRVVSA